MRKLFTSVVAALCLAAPVGTLSAQNTQQLTEAQKEAIKKEAKNKQVSIFWDGRILN